MMKMKSERPLLINGIPQTEFETTIQHGKELKAAGLAVPVDDAEDKDKAIETPRLQDVKMEDAPENKMADAPANKSRTKKAD